jgi:hypothetical protein
MVHAHKATAQPLELHAREDVAPTDRVPPVAKGATAVPMQALPGAPPCPGRRRERASCLPVATEPPPLLAPACDPLPAQARRWAPGARPRSLHPPLLPPPAAAATEARYDTEMVGRSRDQQQGALASKAGTYTTTTPTAAEGGRADALGGTDTSGRSGGVVGGLTGGKGVTGAIASAAASVLPSSVQSAIPGVVAAR